MAEKVKKTLSTEQLEKLKVAREKALSVRQTNAKNKALEKELVVAEKEQHINLVKEKLAKVKAPKQEAPAIIQVESEPEAEPEVVIKKVKKKVLKKKIIVVEDSESDEEQQQVIYVKKVKNNLPVKEPVKELLPEPLTLKEVVREPYENQYNSIFGQRRRF